MHFENVLALQSLINQILLYSYYSAIVRWGGVGGAVAMCGNNLPSLVYIGYTELLKSEGPLAPPAPPGTTTGLY